MSHNDTIDRAFANSLLDLMLPGALDTTQGYDLRAPIGVKEEPVDASPSGGGDGDGKLISVKAFDLTHTPQDRARAL